MPLVVCFAVIFSAAIAWVNALAADDDRTVLDQARVLSQAFRSAAKRVIPSVVKITVEARNGHEATFGLGPWPRGGPSDRGSEEDPESAEDDAPWMPNVGSGVIIDPSGIVLTNEHVVGGGGEIWVELADGRRFKAVEVAVDRQSDLAIVKIDVRDRLAPAKWGDSEALEIGDWVLAVGNPFDLELTVSAGIISGKARVLPSARRAHYLQTDAAINPGNSGGPLVNLEGEVVGINTAIASGSGVYEGVGFAIPSSLARWVADELIAHGRVRRAYLGIVLSELSPELAERMGLGARRAVIAAEIAPGSPAAKARLRPGDVITAFDGKSVSTPRELQSLVERTPVGSTRKLTVMRNGRAIEVAVALETLPDHDVRRSVRGLDAPRAEENRSAWRWDELGIEVAETGHPRLGKSAGVEIVRVDDDGPAAEVGLRPGMRILRVGQQTVESVAQLRSLRPQRSHADESVGQGVLLLVETPEGDRFVDVPRR